MNFRRSLLLFLILFLSSCVPLVVGGVAGAAGGAVSSAKASEHERHSAGTYAVTVLANVPYFPAKVIFAGGGAVVSGIAYIITFGNGAITNSIWNASVLGDYLVTPRMIEGHERVRFVGS